MAAITAASSALGVPESVARAMGIDPDPGTTYLDAEHVVILMQENRSFEHIYGTLRGVRGYNDPRAFRLANNNPVWLQTDGSGKTYAPWRLDIQNTKITWMGSLPHPRNSQVDAWNKGLYDDWIDAKRSSNANYGKMPLTMGHYTRADVPFYYSLADAFTVCDHNFSGAMSSTTPNRLIFMTGTLRENQNSPSYAKANMRNENTSTASKSWATFADLLQTAGVSWKGYQNIYNYSNGLDDTSDDWLGNYTATFESFTQFNIKSKGSGLSGNALDMYNRAFGTNSGDPNYKLTDTLNFTDDTGTARSMVLPKGDLFYQFRKDVNSGNLPTVSWMFSPHYFSGHPSVAYYAAWYVSEILNILTANPEVWKKTIFILTHDENDGYFDHIPPFVCPNPSDPASGAASAGIDTGLEFVTLAQDIASLAGTGDSNSVAREGPIGLGYRVPMVVASPWSRGGWVNSEVFDHSSTLRFLEKFCSAKSGKTIKAANISQWRRTVSGDLTSCFRPYNGETLDPLPLLDRDQFAESIYQAQYKVIPTGFTQLTPDQVQDVLDNPVTSQYLTRQEPGIKPACANNYELYSDGALSADKTNFVLSLKAGNALFGANSCGGAFNACSRDLTASPYMVASSYAVTPGDTLTQSYKLTDFTSSKYHVTVQGPNGFYRQFKGSAADPTLNVACGYNGLHVKFTLTSANTSSGSYTVTITDNAYQGGTVQQVVDPNTTASVTLDVSKFYGWYDFTVTVSGNTTFSRRYAGHVENGQSSYTDPLMGGVIPGTTAACVV